MEEQTARAQRLAEWVNTHDDGTPQPRATVIQHRGRAVVDIASTDYFANGTFSVAHALVADLAQARAVLGY